MNEKVLIFDNAEDFLQVMEDLQEQYIKQNEGAVETNAKL